MKLSSVNMKEQIENEYAIIYSENNIITGVFKNVIIDLEGAKQIVSDRKIISGHEDSLILVDARKTLKMTKEARDYFGSDEGASLLIATALLVDSAMSSFLANFLIGVSFKKAKFPIKVYSDKNKAKDWLRTFS